MQSLGYLTGTAPHCDTPVLSQHPDHSLTAPHGTKEPGQDWNLDTGTLSEVKGLSSIQEGPVLEPLTIKDQDPRSSS